MSTPISFEVKRAVCMIIYSSTIPKVQEGQTLTVNTFWNMSN